MKYFGKILAPSTLIFSQNDISNRREGEGKDKKVGINLIVDSAYERAKAWSRVLFLSAFFKKKGR